MGHLMTDDDTNSAIVEGIVSRRVKEWNLQNTSREANLIGRWVIVGVNRLWSHVPLLTVNGFPCLLANT